MQRTDVISVHHTRRAARKMERQMTAILSRRNRADLQNAPFEIPAISLYSGGPVLPGWAQGVRVRKAGRFQWEVEATAWPG